MADFFDRRNRALHKHYQSTLCTHETTALAKRTVKNGAVQYVQQCQRCGDARSNPISREKALVQNGGTEPPAFSEELSKAHDAEREAGAEQIIGKYKTREEFQRAEFREWYDKYLQSEEWAAIRAKVLTRANFTCEGCLDRPAVLAHHTSYEHVGNEFLFELLALCQSCHDRVHEEKTRELDDDDA